MTCLSLINSTYKERYPDDTDDPEAVGVSSEDEAEDMEEVLGISRRLQKPAPSPAEPSTSKPATPAEPQEKGTIRVQKKGLKRAQGILKDILTGKKVKMSTGASSQDVPFEVSPQPGETDCPEA